MPKGPPGEVPSVVLVYLSVLTSPSPSFSPEKLSFAWVSEHPSCFPSPCLGRTVRSAWHALPDVPIGVNPTQPRSPLLRKPSLTPTLQGLTLPFSGHLCSLSQPRGSCCTHVAVTAMDFGGAVPVIHPQV